MAKMGQFYLNIKEEYESATESIRGLDDELKVVRVDQEKRRKEYATKEEDKDPKDRFFSTYRETR